MAEILVKKAESRREMNDFVALPRRLYRHCPQYVPDLDIDIRQSFDARKNAGLAFSEVQPFVAYNAEGRCVGRIAGIINTHANEQWGTRNVRFGLIEFEDDKDVSRALIQAVEAWGREREMTHIEGPLGITDFDKEGMLVEDFHLSGSAVTIYNPPYYPQHLEALGFEKEVDWLQVQIDIPEEVPAKYVRVAQYNRENFNLHIEKYTAKELRAGVGRRIFELLNEAFAPLFGFSTLSEAQIDEFVDRYVPLVPRDMLPVIVNEKGEIVGAAITMPSLTAALQKTRGRLLPFGWFHLLSALKWRRETTAEMLLIAVRPDLQGLGVNALFFDDLIPVYRRLGITRAETGPQLESNVRELSQWKQLNPRYVKRRRCFGKDI